MAVDVVVIEDDDDLRELVVHNLRVEGFEVIGAATAGEGLASCLVHRPAVVVIDRMLGEIEGLDLCSHLRDDDDLADVAILVLSARGTNEDRRHGFMAGADDYIVKPVTLDELVERVRSLAELASQRFVLRATATR